jgi:NitT/TauT family transport system permease protein
MLFKRLYQFLAIYTLALSLLFLMKYSLQLSDYVIPSPFNVWETGKDIWLRYLLNVMDTLGVTVVGHILSILLAAVVATLGAMAHRIGSFIKTAAFNLQAYPIVAVAPIIFILMGDGLASRLLIAAMICYFPLLLSFIGILTEPIPDIEHFYAVTGRICWPLQVKIRAFENLSKLSTVIAGSGTLAMVGTIVAEFIGADAGIGYSIRIALYQSDMSKILVALFLIGVFTSFYLVLLEWLGFRLQKKWEMLQ